MEARFFGGSATGKDMYSLKAGTWRSVSGEYHTKLVRTRWENTEIDASEASEKLGLGRVGDGVGVGTGSES